MSTAPTGALGTFLRERRTRLDPAALGYAGGRRRTPGLRREEVAQRAGISSTWYSWLEQGRGGAPSAHALDGLAEALMLTEAEREHLFVLGLGRPPGIRYQPPGGITPRLQRVLDAFDASPAIIRTATWDVIAWNRSAAAVLADYEALPLAERNVLRLLFLDPKRREADVDWENVARFVVGVFRGDTVRTGAAAIVQPLVDELRAKSPDFARMWRDSEVHSSCEGVRLLRHPDVGEIALEFSAFVVDSRPDLAMLVYSPVSADDAARVRALSARKPG
ncbi:helix-turn-helix transcriptional regulator [Sphingomonas sp. SRS2]|uniref:helix-turn-helix transcriptional regulator n=1 Tax=Sphingomonas sp. SRS2 TaxID=133190 RepID=UPI0006184DE4|nr:helix-turn-helix transcriptional regulator [Sphingomonas sp. SRS2]KKC24182.1 XRE family transcriptional regulator [Sphingomonas sp. SRS2]